jgi:hypothetical protein
MMRAVFRLIFVFFFLFFPTTAYASETQLTWERSQMQQVEVAPEAAKEISSISLDGQGQSILFALSPQVSSDGRYIYRVLIPTSFRTGEYVVHAAKQDGTFTNLAIIKVVEYQSAAYAPLKDIKTVTTLSVTLFALVASWGINQTEQSRNDGAFRNDQSTLDSAEGGVLGRRAKDRRKFRRGLISSLHLDHLRSVWTISSNHYSPLFSRLISDAGYLQYSLGALVLIFPFAGALLGALAFKDISGFGGITVPSLSILLSILVLATFDASSGFLASIMFGLCALTSHRFQNIFDIRLYLGLSILWFAPSFIANATRSLRKSRKDSEPWERLIDVVVGSFITGWAIHNLVSGLNGLAHLKLPISNHAGFIGLVIGLCIAARYLVEEYVNSRNHYYLSYLSPSDLNELSPSFRLLGWFVKGLIFLLFAVSFLGLSWQIWAALIMLLVPTMLKEIKEKFPNSPFLFQLLPVGIPAIVTMTLLGKFYSPFINSLNLDPASASRTIFVLAAIPGFVIGLLKFFGRKPKDGDSRWYMRTHNVALYRVGGVFMFATYLGLTLGFIG